MSRKPGVLCFILTGLLFVSSVVFAQSSWVATLPWPTGSVAQSVSPAPDGGCFVVGSAYPGPNPSFLARLDPNGNLLWSRRYATDTLYDSLARVAASSDGGAFIAGLSSAPVTWRDLWVLRVDEEGAVLWQRRLSSLYHAMEEETIWDLRATPDGGCIAVVDSAGIDPLRSWSAWIVKFSADGSVMWQRATPSGDEDRPLRLTPSPGGGYWLIGLEHQTNPSGIWLARLNESGTVVAHRYFEIDMPSGRSLRSLRDGGLLTSGLGVGQSFGVARLDSAGGLLWARWFTGCGGRFAGEAPDGGILMAGEEAAEDWSWQDFWLAKLDAFGTILWQKRYPIEGWEELYGADVTPDGGCVLHGWATPPGQMGGALILKVDGEGNLADGCVQPVPGTGRDAYFPFAELSGGSTLSTFGYSDTTPSSIQYLEPPAISLDCSSCTLDCAATVPPSGRATIPVEFKARALASGCDGAAAFEWNFGDGSPLSAEQNPRYAYLRTGIYAWSVRVRLGALICERLGVITIAGPPFDVALYDDIGRSRLCANRTTGAWRWEVLRGPGIGTYEGIGRVSVQNGVWTLASLPGEPWGLIARLYERYGKASGSFTYRAKRVASLLVDSNTANNPPGCP